mmetsp:Transcript_53844/g.93557  ORF Transcript_53844/g.93557 Transcript_53844/m.93557 type:complete len:1009 (+) Transcript_53844:87-3113(+)
MSGSSATSCQARAISVGTGVAVGAVGALLAVRARQHWVQRAQKDDEINAELLAWLRSQGLARYAFDLKRHGYEDLQLLRELSASELEEMIHAVRPLVGHAAKFRKSIGRLGRACNVFSSASGDWELRPRAAPRGDSTAGVRPRMQAASVMSEEATDASEQTTVLQRKQAKLRESLERKLAEEEEELKKVEAEIKAMTAQAMHPHAAVSSGLEGAVEAASERGAAAGASASASTDIVMPDAGGATGGGSSSSTAGTRSAQSSSSLSVGASAVLCGLARRPELNGRVGSLCAWDEQSGRWEFQFADGNGTIKVRSENVQLVQKTAANASRSVPEMQVPDEFRCCITQDVMERPVITSDGHTYERTAIAKWLEEHNTSPKTGQELPDNVLRPNHALRAQILAWRERQGLPPLPPWEPEPQETVQPRHTGAQSSETMHALMVQTPAGSYTVPLAQVQVNNGTTTIVGNEAWLTQLFQANAALRDEISSAIRLGPSEEVTNPDVEDLARTAMREPRLLEMVMQFLHNDPDARSQVPILAGHGLQSPLNPAVDNPLFRAAREGETGVVEQLLGPNAPQRFQRDISPAGDSLLHVASWCGHARLSAMLLARGHPLHMTSRNRSTALHYACWRGHLDVVRQLLEARMDTERKMMGGDTALHQAAWQDHPEILAALLDRRASVNATKDNGDSALALAAVRGHERSCRELLTHMAGADTGDAVSTYVCRRNNSGRCPLHAAATSGKAEIVKLLLEAHASANARSNNEETPLHHAVQVGAAHAVTALLEARADVGVARLEDEHTALELAILCGRAAIIPILVERGASPSSASSRRDGLAPMHMAVMHEATHHNSPESVISALLEARAELDVPSRTGLTPLHVVLGQYPQVPQRRSSTLRNLLERRADLEAAHQGGERALHMAVNANLRVEAAILMECRAQVNAAKTDGSTPLHLAAQHGAREIAELLLRNGASVSACNEAGQTPEDVANQYGLTHVAGLLQRHVSTADSNRQASSSESI